MKGEHPPFLRGATQEGMSYPSDTPIIADSYGLSKKGVSMAESVPKIMQFSDASLVRARAHARGVILPTPRLEEEDLEEEEEELIICQSADELIDRLWREIHLPEPDARRAFRRFGIASCERAYIQTTAMRADGYLRKPAGWFIATLNKGLVWTPEEVTKYRDQPYLGGAA
jgi:hypothetical protein